MKTADKSVKHDVPLLYRMEWQDPTDDLPIATMIHKTIVSLRITPPRSWLVRFLWARLGLEFVDDR